MIIHLVLTKNSRRLKDCTDGEVIIVPPEDEKGKDSFNSYPSSYFRCEKKQENFEAPLPSRYGSSWQCSWSTWWIYQTLNLVLLDRTYMPADGVYVVDVEIQRQKYRAMASVRKKI